MRLLANENFPRVAVEALRAAGHDVVWIRTDHPGADDIDVLRLAIDGQRVILTFDKDFGALAFRARLPASCGIILFRITLADPDVAAARAVLELSTATDWMGSFAVIEDSRIRMRSLPPVGS